MKQHSGWCSNANGPLTKVSQRKRKPSIVGWIHHKFNSIQFYLYSGKLQQFKPIGIQFIVIIIQ